MTQEAAQASILLVEDDDLLRKLAFRVLRLAGYNVTACANAEEALEVMRGAAAPFQLLISDVIMPGLDGGQLALALRKLQADLPVLFMSGYTDNRLDRMKIELGEYDFLAKPFSPAQLKAAVIEILLRA